MQAQLIKMKTVSMCH